MIEQLALLTFGAFIGYITGYIQGYNKGTDEYPGYEETGLNEEEWRKHYGGS